MTHQEKMTIWREKYRIARDRAVSIDQMVRDRCRKLSREAGLDPNLLGIHPHNAMCSFESGQPWRNVDYSKVRKILWLQREKQFAGYRLAEKLADRYWDILFRKGND